MIPLNPDNLETVHAICKMHARRPDVLSAFEVNVLFDLVERAGLPGAVPEATQAEWDNVGQSLLALDRAASTPPVMA